MTNSIYAPRLEYISCADDPEKELIDAIYYAFKDETLFKCFGYLFKTNDRYKMVFIINSNVFEMDVIIQDKSVTIIKGAFNDIKMYLVAKISRHISDINVPESGFQYIQKRIQSILTSVDCIDFVNINIEISGMESLLKKIKNTCGSLDIFSSFRNNLKRFHSNNIMKQEMASETGFGMKLSHYLATVKIQNFALEISKLNLILNLLEYSELNSVAKAYCKIALLDYHHVNYEHYQNVVYEVAEWIHKKYFNGDYSNELELDMDEVD